MKLLAMVVLLAATGCVSPARTVVMRSPDGLLQGPREVAIIRARSMKADAQGDVERALDAHLRDAGFRVKRYVTEADITAPSGNGLSTTLHAPLVRYVLECDWQVSRMCQGGGFLIDRFRVDVIDMKQNEIVMTTEATSGYSEECLSFSGRVFGGVAEELAKVWAPESGRKQPPESQAR